MYDNLKKYFSKIASGFDSISEIRKSNLNSIISYVENKIADGKPVNLIFICSHNSRRSQMAQIWAQTSAILYSVPNIQTFSGGTEVTAFNQRAIAALTKAGFQIDKITTGKNPVYNVRFDDKYQPLECYSKVYNESPNPQSNYCAVMTCSDADANCPIVAGADERVAIPYDDPGDFDGTEHEDHAYNDACLKISIEMFYIFKNINFKIIS